MMRIRYDFKDGIGESRQTYALIKDDKTIDYVKVFIDKNDFKYYIVNSEEKVVTEGGNTKNYIVLLRQAKRALKKLGCEFAYEERDRNYGLIRKRILARRRKK